MKDSGDKDDWSVWFSLFRVQGSGFRVFSSDVRFRA